MLFIQKIHGKQIPNKQAVPLQVFPSKIDELMATTQIEHMVQKQLRHCELENGIDYEVNTYVIDFRKAFLERKIKWIQNKILDPDFKEELPSNFTQYHLANMVNDIQTNKECNFEEEILLRNLVDYQWQETEWWQKKFLAFYMIFYLFPFFYQIFQTDYRTVIVCNVSCMITIVWLFVYEFMQYNLTTFDDYIEDKWNKFDVAHIAMYGCCYFWLRMTRPEDSIINFFQFEDKIAI